MKRSFVEIYGLAVLFRYFVHRFASPLSSPSVRYFVTLFEGKAIAGLDPPGDGLAQPFQQPFQVRHAFAQFAHFATQVFDVLPQPSIARQDQPGQSRPYLPAPQPKR